MVESVGILGVHGVNVFTSYENNAATSARIAVYHIANPKTACPTSNLPTSNQRGFAVGVVGKHNGVSTSSATRRLIG